MTGSGFKATAKSQILADSGAVSRCETTSADAHGAGDFHRLVRFLFHRSVEANFLSGNLHSILPVDHELPAKRLNIAGAKRRARPYHRCFEAQVRHRESIAFKLNAGTTGEHSDIAILPRPIDVT